jgi:hypothetical protein
VSSAAAPEAAGAGGSTPRVRGSTTIVEFLKRHPDGAGQRLLAAVGVPCALCGAAIREPITLAARRHGRDPGAFLRVFQALDDGWPDAVLIEAARERAPGR